METEQLSSLLALFQHHPNRDTLRGSQSSRVLLDGLQGSAVSLLIALLERPFFCIAPDEESAGYLYSDLSTLVEEGAEQSLLFFPSRYKRGIRYGQKDLPNELLRSQLIDTLSTLQSSSSEPSSYPIVVTYPEAILEGIPLPTSGHLNNEEVVEASQRKIISKGDILERKSFREELWNLGFEEVDYVYLPGQFAVRGSIIDVFSFAHFEPIRIDFFGDEIESLRPFDPETQISHTYVETFTLLPPIETTQENSNLSSILSLLPLEYTLYIERLDFLLSTFTECYSAPPVHPEDNIFPSLESLQAALIPPTQLLSEIENRTLWCQTIPPFSDDVWQHIEFTQRAEPLFHKNFQLLEESLLRLQKDGYRSIIMSSQKSQLKRLKNIFEDQHLSVSFQPMTPTLHSGFIDETLKIALFSDHTIFERYHNYQLKSDQIRRKASTLTLKDIQGFEFGDYIVHVNHGIGTFGGLFTIEQNGRPVEVVRLNYRDGDYIYVSIHALHHISKYKSRESEEPPKLSKLGSGAWDKIKEKTKKKVKDIARDLIHLYAERLKVKGFAYSPDTYLQQELEASFQYEDTPDQEQATAQVKADMERPVPMDRLICGDVGFGKTEIAIRAAFKAVADNKQVALLVPTTLLAYQHYRTFSKRLENFPCRIEYISHAKSLKERKEILKELESGKIDIIIGTHALVGKEVKYHNLGLLIIDEEQKFGVRTKEQLRKNRTSIDTLTMTATPIPRTLQFSLMGARDLSNITTPPPNRYPIRTDHTRYSIEVLREVINAEMARDGQVFFIHNRIHNIEDIARDILKAVPGLRIGMVHGRLPSKEIEETLLKFVSHDYDLLLATSIIENGIDVPNANTIIINDAHRFGLSDLHQFRGRVGRSNKKAYCVLLTPALEHLTPNAKRRLQSITTFSELGSGIHLAMQDLYIRGAGNMLGSEQSGFIADLGYETYKRVLEESVHELKEEEFQQLFEENNPDAPPTSSTQPHSYLYETTLDTDFPAFLPANYVPGDDERIALYKELDSISSKNALSEYTQKLRNRFGTPPQEANELIKVIELKFLGKELGVERIILRKNLLKLFLVSDLNSHYYKSSTFSTLLQNATNWEKPLQFKEEKGRRSISIQNITSISMAYDTLLQLGTPKKEA